MRKFTVGFLLFLVVATAGALVFVGLTPDFVEPVKLTSQDVVRHPLVQKIVQAYDEYEKKAKPENHSGRAKSTTRKRRENK